MISLSSVVTCFLFRSIHIDYLSYSDFKNLDVYLIFTIMRLFRFHCPSPYLQHLPIYINQSIRYAILVNSFIIAFFITINKFHAIYFS